MRGRSFLVGLIVAATATLVIGVVLERNAGETHPPEATAPESKPAPSGEGEAAPGVETGPKEETNGGEARGEAKAHVAEEASGSESDARVLGVDLESRPFVILAALASLGLAAAAWVRPRWILLFVAIALAMLVFASLDVREVTHQLDENRDGLAILAGVVAALHLGAALVAAASARCAAGRTVRSEP